MLTSYVDKKANLQSLLQHEEKQSRDNAHKVMERIMADSGPEKKVCLSIPSDTWHLSCLLISVFYSYRYSSRSVSLLSSSLARSKKQFNTW